MFGTASQEGVRLNRSYSAEKRQNELLPHHLLVCRRCCPDYETFYQKLSSTKEDMGSVSKCQLASAPSFVFFQYFSFSVFFCLSVLHINIKGLQGSFVKGSVSSWCPAAGPPRLCVASTPPPPPPPRNHSAPPPTIASTNQQLSLPTFSPGDNPSQPLTSDSCNPHLFQLQSVEAKLMVVMVRLESLLSSSSSSSVGRVGGRGSYPAQ